MELLTLFNKGGLIMFPIVIASIAAVMIALERGNCYRRAALKEADFSLQLNRYIVEGDVSKITELCRRGGAVGEVILESLETERLQKGNLEELVQATAKRKALELRRYLEYLSVIVTIAPLLGLLGTVLGMMNSFSILNISDGQPFAITSGVGEALIATATGLLVAILALCLYTWLSHTANRIIADIEYASMLYVSARGGKVDEA